jgi:hypothetical protein
MYGDRPMLDKYINSMHQLTKSKSNILKKNSIPIKVRVFIMYVLHNYQLNQKEMIFIKGE